MTLVAERWDAADVPAADRDDAFREVVSATHLPWSLTPGELVPGPAGLVRYRVGDLALVDCRCGPCSGSRGRSQLAATDDDVVGVLFVRSGLEQVEVGGTRVVLGPGAALLWRADEPARFRVPGRLHKWTLLVPSSRLPGARSGLLDPAAAGLLTALLGSTLASAASLDGRLGQPVADAAVDLLAGALAPPDDAAPPPDDAAPPPDDAAPPPDDAAPPPDDAAWARVTAHVEAHLRDPSLTPAAIAAGAYVSERSLYGLFAARGLTPAGYVRRRRLEGAARELARRGTAVTVAAVAHCWGFRDPTTFGRGFRTAFGRTPDEVRRGR
ncbi:helix-turn-helix domain-containing protein [Geodermatophilus sabuli]|uniref:AraC-type DNA-binding protein n=1 Tax=Geodermatophilus sabuli TaxID=1564158 RepID=A0A285EF33_9ACTN|nr:helix-turn-helix domain-containing protein [Geodermatophilus sabuli]MBB3086630.1 AraC-like DNA-binding protein [Geodermatophilus sabuli]SNX97718.1 AraC-type DNA-binding protein [Geodermatophilus sabuli]